jgi:maleate isomerase
LQGLEVVSHAACDLPSNQRSINPSELYDWVLAHMPARCQAVFVGGIGLRSVGVIAALEEELARPVLTANQVLLRGVLRAIRSRVSIRGYGQLFTVTG